MPPDRVPLRDLALFFLRLGTTAFGGPAVHVALMEDELVTRRGWLTKEEFLDLLGAANLVPGPTSTELAIHIGYRKAGWRGLLLGGLCFLLPAALLTAALAWAYVRWGRLPAAAGILYGLSPVVIALVGQALWRLSRTALRTGPLIVLAFASALAFALGAPPLAVLFGAGLLAGAARAAAGRARALALLPALAGGAAPAAGLLPLFLVFLKTGALVMGSGYVLLAFLRDDLVTRLGWLTERQLLDAISVGQVTPGPVSTTATFIGWVVAGPTGAVVATAAIFVPGFVYVAASGWLVPRLRAARATAAFLDGVNAAAVALVAVVGVQLARGALVDVPALVLFLAAEALLLRTKTPPALLLLAGALAGLVLRGLS